MRDILRILVTAVWAMVGILSFYMAYGPLLARFNREELWDLERSLGGFTIPITKTMSMDVLWFHVVNIAMFLVLWSALLVGIMNRLEKMMPNHRFQAIGGPGRPPQPEA